MRYFKLLLAAICLAVAVLFFVQNYELLSMPTTLKLNFEIVAFFGMSIPLYALILGAFGLGVLLSLIFLIIDKIHCSRQIRSYRKKLKALEQEVNSLRNLPLSEQGFGGGLSRESGDDPLGGSVHNPEDSQV